MFRAERNQRGSNQLGPSCGDGRVQAPREECDEGPSNGNGACLQNCKINVIP
jgi:hypothetical protein